MVKNLYVMEDIQRFLKNEIDLDRKERVDIHAKERSFALQRDNFWEQLSNPKTTISYFIGNGIDILAEAGVVINVLSLLFIFLYSFSLGDTQLAKISQSKIQQIFHYASFTFLPTIIACALSLYKSSPKEQSYRADRRYMEREKFLKERIESLQKSLNLIQKASNNPTEFNILRKFIETVDMSGNEQFYNVRLVTLLSIATQEPTLSNFKAIEKYLYESLSNEEVSKEFLQNDLVVDMIECYQKNI